MQKKLFPVLLLLLALGLAACSTATDPGQPAAEAAATDTPAPTVAPTQETAAPQEPVAETEAANTEADLRTFTVAPDRSEVRFVIDEVLRGNPTTVVGTNSRVTGELTVDLADPANTQIGPIEVDAAGFVTDEDRRNSAIRRFILQTAQYPVVTFTPRAISGLPETATIGDSFDFQVTGDLAILDSTNPATFDLTASVVSENELQITGESTINRADYGISIPSVPFVASVGEDLVLELDLVALAN